MAGLFAWLRRKKQPDHLLDGPDMYYKPPVAPQHICPTGGAAATPETHDTAPDAAEQEGYIEKE